METRLPMTRHKELRLYNFEKHQPYDYETSGLLNKILPTRITNTQNDFTKGVLRFVEYMLVWLMKYVDTLKHFKDYNYRKY